MARNELTEAARLGYDGNPNPYLYSSPCWYACQLGIMFHATGRPVPTGVRMGRGSSVHAGDMTFRHADPNHWERVR